MDLVENDYNAYKLLEPISYLYSEQCNTKYAGILRFCGEFNEMNIVELTTEFHKTQEMCVKLKVSESLRLLYSLSC